MEAAGSSSAAAGRRSPQITQLLGACKSIRNMLMERRETFTDILYPEWYTDLESLFIGPIGAIRDASLILRDAEEMSRLEIPEERAEAARRDLNLLLQHGQAAEANLDRVIHLVRGRDREDAEAIIRREMGVALAAESRLPPDVLSGPEDDVLKYLWQHCRTTIVELERRKLVLVGILYPGWLPVIALREVDADLDSIFKGPLEALEDAMLELEQARLLGVAAEWAQIGWAHLDLLQRHRMAAETELDALVSLVQGRDPVSARIILRLCALTLNFHV